jgi:hypothetical protein
MSIKERGSKLDKTPSLEKPSPTITIHLEMEMAFALRKAIDTLYL